jgi:hypothetical protein
LTDFVDTPNDDLVQPTGFLCPECSLPLRLRDRSQLGREINCPDCGTLLRLQADGGTVQAVRVELIPTGLPVVRRDSRTKLRLIWAATACLGVFVLWLSVRSDESPARGVTPEPVAADPLKAAEEPSAPPVAAEIVEPPAATLPMVPEPIAAPLVPVVVPPKVAAEDERPLNPVLAADPPPVDIPAQLSLKITEFAQLKPAEVRLLLRQIAELGAVPVDLSEVEVEPWKERLDRAITLELKDTTLAAVLNEILHQSNLGSRWQDGIIYVTPPPRARAQGERGASAP